MPAGIEAPGLFDYRCGFGDRRPQEVVTYIVHRLQELLGADERDFYGHMTMLEVFSENRNLKG